MNQITEHPVLNHMRAFKSIRSGSSQANQHTQTPVFVFVCVCLCVFIRTCKCNYIMLVISIYINLCTCNKLLKYAIFNAKRMYSQQYFTIYKSNMEKTCRMINSLLNKNVKQNEFKTSFNINWIIRMTNHKFQRIYIFSQILVYKLKMRKRNIITDI